MRKKSLAVMGIAIVIFGLIGSVIWAGGQVWKTPSDLSDTVAFAVAPGESAHQIAAHLKRAGLIDSVWLFEAFVRWTGRGNRLQAGSYSLTRGEGISSLFMTLRYGIRTTDVEVTIPEGYTLSQIGALVESKLGIINADWQAATGVDSPFEGTMPLLSSKPDDVDLEGYLFPDTYRFAPGSTANDVVQKLLETTTSRIEALQIAFIDEACEDDCWWIENTHELLTLASIIEREVMTDVDRPIVADVFLKRLKIGMPLQADSTVNYVTGKKTPSVSLDDLQIDSPYNTYRYPGLPPGPISNPGMAAIKAVANPTPNDYYYFLTTDEGQVIYAETHDEHVANKARYR